jgi:hypothetical protein
MRNPLQRLKYLPWLQLSLTAFATTLITFVVETVLGVGLTYSPVVQTVLTLLFAPPLGIITLFAIALGIGALAVYWLERVYPRIIINTGVLWALVLCVIVAFFLKSLLPLPVNLVTPSQFVMVGILVGIFWRGRRYWRWR